MDLGPFVDETDPGLPLVATGAADAFDLDQGHLALSCASHNGEPGTSTRSPSGSTDSGSTPTPSNAVPISRFTRRRRALVHDEIAPDRRHNNCSGKHAGFLTVCRHLGIDPPAICIPSIRCRPTMSPRQRRLRVGSISPTRHQ